MGRKTRPSVIASADVFFTQIGCPAMTRESLQDAPVRTDRIQSLSFISRVFLTRSPSTDYQSIVEREREGESQQMKTTVSCYGAWMNNEPMPDLNNPGSPPPTSHFISGDERCLCTERLDYVPFHLNFYC